MLSVIGIGPGSQSMMTMEAIEALQAAEIYCAANYLIQICILFDTTGIQTTANYLIPNSPSFDSF